MQTEGAEADRLKTRFLGILDELHAERERAAILQARWGRAAHSLHWLRMQHVELAVLLGSAAECLVAIPCWLEGWPLLCGACSPLIPSS